MNAVVVAKTRMGKNICVGAVDADTGGLLRLIPTDGAEYHSWREFDASVGSIIEFRGRASSNTIPPHVEDFLVDSWNSTGKRKKHLASWIKSNCSIWTGQRSSLFGGKLRFVGAGMGLVNKSDELPNASVGFWEVPRPLRKVTANEKVRMCMDGLLPVNMPYVGEDVKSLPDTLPKGTLVRLSLSRWLAPREPTFEAACWLQISGVYSD